MTTISNTKENLTKVKSLKMVSETNWIGNTIHDTLDKCLTSINLQTTNSGWYKPTATKIDGLKGIFMINQDGSIFCEAKVIKEGEKKYRIEYLSTNGWNQFENLYCEYIDEN